MNELKERKGKGRELGKGRKGEDRGGGKGRREKDRRVDTSTPGL